ncbi:Small subunit ribosomal protein S11 [Fasciola hepatica]|uniref:Small ribosomal subunit protein uS17 n=1 Tax=Fasciola hepatica TaxID=6192 RepID=A0A4E0RKG4_FASHE|nr:Small subunit ribosomal protein S11 [Fasciola hepatica]
MAEQKENAFQKQQVKGKKGGRHYKSIGLGYKTPREAMFGNYIDKKCPFTGDVRIRGRILNGVVRKTKMNRTIVIRRDYLKLKLCFTSLCSDVNVGDTVTVGECRPLSKTVSFNVIKVFKAPGSQFKKSFQKF